METEIEGLAELEEKLTTQTRAVCKKVLRKAGKRAGAVFKGAIEENIERQGLIDSEFLIDHIGITTRVGNGTITIKIGPTTDMYPLEHGRTKNRDANEVALFAEFGTKNEPAKPFMRPAYSEKSDEAIEIFVEELTQGLKDLET